tara:strand:- start:421 stop:543 length:123 start_codon:yes stop_codon:yes gene_type:complete
MRLENGAGSLMGTAEQMSDMNLNMIVVNGTANRLFRLFRF